MKHKLLITLIILGMFLITQSVGIYVVMSDGVPDFLDSSTDVAVQSSAYYFYQIIVSFIFAILIFSLITKYKLKLFMKMWFFLVVVMALSISIFAILKNNSINFYWVALLIAFVLAIFKIFRPSIIIHNATEILIYPGVAAIFVPLLNPLYAIILLVVISIYDMWAVWHSGLMMRMAKFQMKELKVFGGFFIPYLTKQMRGKIKAMKKSGKKKMVKVRLAILGGGDVVFPIITAGVFLKAFGIISAIYVLVGAFIGLTYLLIFGKDKPYPAMPYITAGIFLGILTWLLPRLF